MSKKYKAEPLSYRKIERIAMDFLRRYYPDLYLKPGVFPALDFFESGNFERITGFTFEVRDLPDNCDGITIPEKKLCILSNSCYERLERNDSRALFSAAHELGHVILHALMKGLVFENTKLIELARDHNKKYEDSEWQANAFAASLLMPIHHIMHFVENQEKFFPLNMEIAWAFGTSLESVRYRLNTYEAKFQHLKSHFGYKVDFNALLISNNEKGSPETQGSPFGTSESEG